MHTDYTLHLLLLSPRRLLSLPPVSSSSSSASSRLLSAVSQTQTSVTSILTATHPAEQACVASSPNSRGGLHWRCLIPPHCQRNSAPSTRASISGTRTYGYACSLTLPYLTLRYLPTPLLPHASHTPPSASPPTRLSTPPLPHASHGRTKSSSRRWQAGRYTHCGGAEPNSYILVSYP